MSIDRFFQSLAEDRRERCIGVILSGTGTDGTQGLRAIKDLGGMTIAQSPDSAEYDGMARSAISMSAVDFVVPIKDMPRILNEYARRPDRSAISVDSDEQGGGTDYLNKIIAHLRARSRYDLRCYKKSTLARRIQRRMRVRNVPSLEGYLQVLREKPDEPDELFNDLLIGVTSFFRDPQAWEELDKKVLSGMIKNAPENGAIRVWVPGCSTGQEAYTLAILLFERIEKENRPLEIQIFGTDVDSKALEFARKGVYAESVAEEVPADKLNKYFGRSGQNYVVAKGIREKVVFALQNTVSDPPFSKLDLISCRNLMIYLESDVQARMLRLFHFALNEGGYLFLGSSESIGKLSEQFKVLSKKWRIYQRTGALARPDFSYGRMHKDDKDLSRTSGMDTGKRDHRVGDRHAEMANQMLLEQYAPAAVVISKTMEIVYLRGPVDRYLRFPTGELTRELSRLLREGISSPVRAAIRKAQKDRFSEVQKQGQVKRDDGYHPIDITVRHLPELPDQNDLLLVTFSDVHHHGPIPAPSDPVPADESVVRQLELELRTTKDQMAGTVSDLETANEELKASNEEIMSMNEEFQSTNEELETSREELQSLNEELTTVNNQLEEKVDELETANDDLRNLLSSTDIGVVFLDSQLRIKRFTRSSEEVIRLIPGDIGRSVSDMAHAFREFDLSASVKEVSESLQPRVHETESTDGKWYNIRILPYRTEKNIVEGIVLTFMDVTKRHQEIDDLLEQCTEKEQRVEELKKKLRESGVGPL